MVANERGLSPLRVFVVLFSIQIIFFLYHVALSNPGYVNPAAVIPWALKVSGKMGECMDPSPFVSAAVSRAAFVSRYIPHYHCVFPP